MTESAGPQRLTGIGWLDTIIGRLFPQGALLLSVLTFGSYVVGLVRDRVQARTFGAGAELDAYNAAFQIPEVALGVLVGSGLAAPFIPIFLGLRQENEQAARDFAGTILTLATLIILVATPVLFVIAPQTVDWVATGFDDRQRALYTDLFRLMLITPLLFAISDRPGRAARGRAAVPLVRPRADRSTTSAWSLGRSCSRRGSGSSGRPSGRSSGRTAPRGPRPRDAAVDGPPPPGAPGPDAAPCASSAG